ncbi:FAD-dependent oxidoreductase (plasmid) [Rhodococcus opacus]|uniref:oxidoreductase n=1 Tax=Rhodococcus opacus TaxID=37919 RepID=UPI0034D2BAFB
MRDRRHDILFEPVTIGPNTMRNRFFQAAHCSGAGSDPQTQTGTRWTDGGWAVVSTEYCLDSPDADDFPRLRPRPWDDGDARNLSFMTEEAHRFGALAAVELWHCGVLSAGMETRHVMPGVPQSPNADGGVITGADQMDRDDIRRVQQEYVQAALLAQNAGFDILTVAATSTADIPYTFLTPMFNRRTDGYGGLIENRTRFHRELFTMLKEAVGDDMTISFRIGIDTLGPSHGLRDAGIGLKGDSRAIIESLNDYVDMWDLNVRWFEWSEDAGPSRIHTEKPQAPYMVPAKNYTDKPVINVGHVTNPDAMAEMIKTGHCDIIGASVADPFLPKKIDEGRYEDIREDIGFNKSLPRFEMDGTPITCTQNATVGEGFHRAWYPEKFDKVMNVDNDVLVIGAGPAGMECARVLGERGFRNVHLVDASSEIGGSMKYIPDLPGLSECRHFVDYQKIALDKLSNVTIILNKEMTPQDVLEYGASIVVVATGSRWAHDGMNGFTHAPVFGAGENLAHVRTPDDVMAGGSVGQKVVVYDADGYFMGAGIAEKLLRDRKNVTYVTPFGKIAPFAAKTLEAPRLNRTLRELGLKIIDEHILTAVEPGTVSIAGERGGESTVEADTTIMVTQRNSRGELYSTLNADALALEAEGITALYRIGDCESPNIVAEALFAGDRPAASEVNGPNSSGCVRS